MGWKFFVDFWESSKRPEAAHILQEQKQNGQSKHVIFFLFLMAKLVFEENFLLIRSLCSFYNNRVPLEKLRSKLIGLWCLEQLPVSILYCRKVKADQGIWKLNSSGLTSEKKKCDRGNYFFSRNWKFWVEKIIWSSREHTFYFPILGYFIIPVYIVYQRFWLV